MSWTPKQLEVGDIELEVREIPLSGTVREVKRSKVRGSDPLP